MYFSITIRVISPLVARMFLIKENIYPENFVFLDARS